jgi:aminoglycoside phosphotransferase (APT) family kinase protein
MHEQTAVLDLENHIVEALVYEDFGLKLKGLQKASHNHVQNIVRVGETAVVRISRFSPSRFPINVEGYRLFQEQGIPVPTVLGYQEAPRNIGAPTIILSRVPGEILYDILPESSDERDEYFRKAGAILRKIHTIPIYGFGEMEIVNGSLRGRNNSWKDHLSHWRSEKIIKRMFDEQLLTHHEYDALTAAYTSSFYREIDEPVYLHNDFHTKNILFENSEVTGVIDLCNSIAGDPMYDLANSLFFLSEDDRQVFLGGYGEDVDNEALHTYLILIAGLKIDSRLRRGQPDRADVAKKKLQGLLIQN